MVVFFFVATMLVGLWLACGAVSFWLLTKLQDKITLDDVTACLFGPIMLLKVIAEKGRNFTIWKKKGER